MGQKFTNNIKTTSTIFHNNISNTIRGFEYFIKLYKIMFKFWTFYFTQNVNFFNCTTTFPLLSSDKTINEIKLVYKYVENKWKYIDDWKCCDNKCVNTNKPTKFCTEGNGFGQIKKNGENKIAGIKAENNFIKPINELIQTYTLYYFEVELKFEENELISIGLTNNNHSVYLFPNYKLIFCLFQTELRFINLPSFTYKTNDIIGCGLVYPPPKITNKLPYIFFTLNGKQIGKAILLHWYYSGLFRPCVELRCCSIETNFGNNSFIYDVFKYCVTEEFYKEEEFLKYFVFKYVENRWNNIDGNCCDNKCVNNNKPTSFCREGNGFIRIKSNTEIKMSIKLPSFTCKTNDIFGCGLVYPPPKLNNEVPYVFFTKNGKQIGKAILLEENYELFRPYVGLECCSIEANFGDNPFIYDVSKHDPIFIVN
ncbi:Reverse transcriptase domain-containing protein [Meloidogyne graminicola]|uniref:Reverse transcriptase domain-containing protein n=1 Tax=Meloidogyne graminicola TaxID=189291 RepID=A0A8S9ZJY4_9BILA|nr:Reverse transcriptase domain-containing protein [Meloidogyne graminicola]